MRRSRIITDLPEITLQQIEHFFAHYKDLEPNKWVKIERWGDADEARQIILESIERAKAKSASLNRFLLAASGSGRNTPCSPNRFQTQGAL